MIDNRRIVVSQPDYRSLQLIIATYAIVASNNGISIRACAKYCLPSISNRYNYTGLFFGDTTTKDLLQCSASAATSPIIIGRLFTKSDCKGFNISPGVFVFNSGRLSFDVAVGSIPVHRWNQWGPSACPWFPQSLGLDTHYKLTHGRQYVFLHKDTSIQDTPWYAEDTKDKDSVNYTGSAKLVIWDFSPAAISRYSCGKQLPKGAKLVTAVTTIRSNRPDCITFTTALPYVKTVSETFPELQDVNIAGGLGGANIAFLEVRFSWRLSLLLNFVKEDSHGGGVIKLCIFNCWLSTV